MGVEIRCPDCRATNPVVVVETGGCSNCGWEPELVVDLTDGATSRTSVLIVDDDPAARQVLRDVLRAGGFRDIYDAPSGPDAALLSQEHRPAVVMLDFVMPAIDGAHTAKLIRRISPRSRIVAFSAILDRTPEWADGCIPKTEVDHAAEVVHLVTAPRRYETQT